MIGKSLNERWGVRSLLPEEEARSLLNEQIGAHAQHILKVRAGDRSMVACLVVRADEAAVRMCRALGLEMRQGGTAVFGLLGADAARIFSYLPEHHRAWLEAPCGARETKVLLVARGVALLSLETEGGAVALTVVPARPPTGD